jgi:hypothetical protein
MPGPAIQEAEALFDLPATLFPVTLPGQSCLDALLFSGLEIERMPLDLFNDVFLLHFSLKAPERIFQCLAVLKSYFRQINTPPNRSVILLPRPTVVKRMNSRSTDIIWA